MDLTVSYNPWLLCAFLWTLRVYGPGLAWSWIFSHDETGNGSSVRQWVVAAALATWTGLVINALNFVLLAELGIASVFLEAAVLVTLTAIGIGVGRRRIRIPSQLPGLALSIAVFAGIMLAPHRGEWIAGGWDPGIYVDQGVAVSRSGTFHPPADPLLQALSADELNVFTRKVHNYTEYLPVVPIDPETREIQHFFFRLTPATVAIADRCGGLRAATRINLFLGWFALLGFGGLLLTLYRDAIRPAVAWALLAAHPIFIYMLHFPTSEMLQLVLVCGTVMLLHRRTVVADAGAAFGIFACLLNRFSFLPFAGILLAALAWRDLERTDRRAMWRGRGMMAFAIVAGLVFDWTRCPITIGRLDELVPPLVGGGLGLVALALMIDACPASSFIHAQLKRIGPRQALILMVLIAGFAVSYDAIRSGTGHVRTLYNVNRSAPYIGVWFMAAAAVGLFALISRRHAFGRRTTSVLLFFGMATVASFTVAAIAPLMPWAVRRLVVYTLPLVAILGAEAAGWAWHRHTARVPARMAVVVAVGLLLASTARLSRQALLNTEFDGLSDVLAATTAHIPEDAVVVADHFRWGTPLHLLHGVHLLNGEVLWEQADPDRMQNALRLLARLHREGRRIVFLTSTDQGLRVYADELGSTTLIWRAEPVGISDMVHRPKNTGFPIRTRSKYFTLHEWTPPHSAN